MNSRYKAAIAAVWRTDMQDVLTFDSDLDDKLSFTRKNIKGIN